jgi:hypothetical protein
MNTTNDNDQATSDAEASQTPVASDDVSEDELSRVTFDVQPRQLPRDKDEEDIDELSGLGPELTVMEGPISARPNGWNTIEVRVSGPLKPWEYKTFPESKTVDTVEEELEAREDAPWYRVIFEDGRSQEVSCFKYLLLCRDDERWVSPDIMYWPFHFHILSSVLRYCRLLQNDMQFPSRKEGSVETTT